MRNIIHKLFFFAVFIAVIASTLCTCSKQKQQGLTITEGILSVGVEIGYPPMEYYDIDGVTLLGFDIELTKALADKLGLEVNYIDTTWEGIFAGLDANRYDIAVNITILPERLQNFNFTRPYIDSSMTIVTRKNSPVRIEKPENITGRRVAFQGDTTAQYFAERLREQGVVFTSFAYDKIINCFDDLALRRIDFVIVDNIVAYHYASAEDSAFQVVWQGLSDEYIAICLKKGNDALTTTLNNALHELHREGVLQEISNRIFNRDMVSAVFPENN